MNVDDLKFTFTTSKLSLKFDNLFKGDKTLGELYGTRQINYHNFEILRLNGVFLDTNVVCFVYQIENDCKYYNNIIRASYKNNTKMQKYSSFNFK